MKLRYGSVMVAMAFVASFLHAEIYTSASYVQNGLIAQWDGIDNVGGGKHDPEALIWKDLVGENDFTIAQGRGFGWRRGIAFCFDNVSGGQAAAYGKEGLTPRYRTIEIVYKMTRRDGRILFYGGNQTRYVLFDPESNHPFNRVYFSGKTTPTLTTPYARVKYEEPTSIVATYVDGEDAGSDAVSEIFCDGVCRNHDKHNNTWGLGDNRITLGWRSLSNGAGYGWAGEVYAIRLYDRVLTASEIARNHAIDEKRFYTSAMYDKTGMVAFWDAKDNAGVGIHDPSAETWMNLVPEGQNLAVRSGAASWTDSALLVNGTGVGAIGTSPLAYSALEIRFRNERLNNYNGYLFSNGSNGYCVLANGRVQWEGGYGIHTFSNLNGGDHSLSWIKGASSTSAYIDGEKTVYESHSDNWGVGQNVVQVGGRTDTYNFKGRIHSLRAYNSEIARERVWQNNKIDKVRYANVLTWAGENGFFGDSGNWTGIGAVQTVPGVENTVDLPFGVSRINLGQDQTVAAIRSRNGCVSHGMPIDATIDMGGNTLTVMGAYQSDATYGFGGNRFARLCLTNGTFLAESIAMGALSDRVVDNSGDWLGCQTAFSIGSGSLSIAGPETMATTRQALSMEGAFTHLRVDSGAKVLCGAGLKVYSKKNRGSSTLPYEQALIEVMDAGTEAALDNLCVYGNADLVISDKANLTVNSGAEISSAAGCSISFIGRTFGTLAGASRMVVDDASLVLKCPGFAVGYSVGSTDQETDEAGSSLTVQNGGTLALSDAMSRLFIGLARVEAYWCYSMRNVLNILGGSTLEGGTAAIEIGAAGNTSFCGFNVSDSVVNCGAVYLGSKSSNTCSSNNFMHVSGTAARIRLAGTDADSFKLRMGSELRFVLPENGFAVTPVVTAGGVTVYGDEDEASVDPVKLIVDDSAFSGSVQTLIECVHDSSDAFQRLVDNHECMASATLKIKDAGRKLVYVKQGFKLIIR